MRCVLPTSLLVESLILASIATKALASSRDWSMRFRAVRLLTRKIAVSRITPVRDSFSRLIPLGSPALFVVCRGLVASR
ncbi:hypothetical protein SBC1_68540 (plasmid) [Caballeronia sp. SBC1]|nr:hypothetical protein SBC2_68280 [Caballeronia sp. SBC2]QIN66807.1 hypothetical protein SBC1_68540 [Caballeronia sp. SBC1]